MAACTIRACVLLTILAFVGCQSRPPLGHVKGTVTYRDKPVPNGTISFIPEVPGTSATGTIEADGSYKLKTAGAGEGALVGKHKVMIVALQDMSGRLPEERNPLPPPIVPVKYMNLATTDLQAEVKQGDNIIDFKLVD
jgi:hypothetical protein